MYKRKPCEYERVDKIAIDIYVDYEINFFPIDYKLLCKKMGIILYPYSKCEINYREILYKESSEGSLHYGADSLKPIIFYNDGSDSIYGNLRQTVLHEIKHFVDEDSDDSDDDLAEHFGRYMSCPTPYLIWNDITDIKEISKKFDVSTTVAKNVSNSVKNRIKVYGHKIFSYEKPMIDLFKK